MRRRGLESPYVDRLKDWTDDPQHGARITTRVQCAEYFPVRDRALLAHATQVDPEGPWFSVPLALHKAAWPTEDWELVRTVVDTEVPEDDLFAGVAVPVASRVIA
jgi:mycothiol S-conjugate amidase